MTEAMSVPTPGSRRSIAEGLADWSGTTVD